MRVRYYQEGTGEIRSATFLDFTRELGLNATERDLLLRVFFNNGVMAYPTNGGTIWAWECPRYEFVQDVDGEPEIESLYVDEITDANRHRVPAKHEVTPEPELVRNKIRPMLEGMKIAAE